MSRDAPLRPAVPGEHLEAAIKALREFGGTQRDDPLRRQLDGQRHTIEALTDLHNGTRIVLGQCKIRLYLAGPLDELTHRIGVDKAC